PAGSGCAGSAASLSPARKNPTVNPQVKPEHGLGERCSQTTREARRPETTQPGSPCARVPPAGWGSSAACCGRLMAEHHVPLDVGARWSVGDMDDAARRLTGDSD